jgi:hypothetical protein
MTDAQLNLDNYTDPEVRRLAKEVGRLIQALKLSVPTPGASA